MSICPGKLRMQLNFLVLTCLFEGSGGSKRGFSACWLRCRWVRLLAVFCWVRPWKQVAVGKQGRRRSCPPVPFLGITMEVLTRSCQLRKSGGPAVSACLASAQATLALPVQKACCSVAGAGGQRSCFAFTWESAAADRSEHRRCSFPC